jgi:hypothetical protein
VSVAKEECEKNTASRTSKNPCVICSEEVLLTPQLSVHKKEENSNAIAERPVRRHFSSQLLGTRKTGWSSRSVKCNCPKIHLKCKLMP